MGAAIFYYELKDAISLSFWVGAKQRSGSKCGVSAIDGGLSMVDIDKFGMRVSVTTAPAPASGFFCCRG